MIMTRSDAVRKRNELFTVQEDASRYIRAQNVLADLRKKYLGNQISSEVYKEAREKALNGSIMEARKILERAMGYD